MSLKTFYDPNTDTIHGAKEGTLAYFHEEGHRYCYKKGIEPMLQMWFIYSMFFTVWCIIFIDWLKEFMIIVCACLMLVSEIHAWVFAFKKYSKFR